MKPKTKVILGFAIFFIAAASVIGYGYYAELREPHDFGEFTVDVPLGSEFEDISSKYDTGGYNFVKSYRCKDKDLTISIFDKNYIENTFETNTGDEIDFGKSVLEHFLGMKNADINKTSENICICTVNQRIGGSIDTDVAGIYNDDEHFIIVEGGDTDFIQNITNSIKIKNS